MWMCKGQNNAIFLSFYMLTSPLLSGDELVGLAGQRDSLRISTRASFGASPHPVGGRALTYRDDTTNLFLSEIEN